MPMHSDELVLLGTEIKRRIFSWRFIAMLAVMTIFTYTITNQMITYEATTSFGYNAWDVFLGVFGNTANALPSPVIFPMLFIFVLGSSVQEDVISGYSLLVQARLERKNAYWWVKILSILIVVAVTIVFLYVISLVMGVMRGFDLFPVILSDAGGNPDAWGIAQTVPPIYYSLHQGSNIVVHTLLVMLYFIFAYFAVVMFVIGITVRSKNVYTPLAVGALFVALQLAISYATTDFLFGCSLVAAFTESMHRVLPSLTSTTYAVPWIQSILLLLGYLIVGVVAGALLTPTRFKGVSGRAHFGHPRKKRRNSVALLVISLSMASLCGCTPLVQTEVSYYDYLGITSVPTVSEVELGDLSDSDIQYLETVSEKTVELSNSVENLNTVWGSENLHASDVEVDALLEERLSAIDGIIGEIRALEVPTALTEWYEVQYEPGLDELEHLDELIALNADGDDLGIFMCRMHVIGADAYFSTAATTIEPYASSAEATSGA